MFAKRAHSAASQVETACWKLEIAHFTLVDCEKKEILISIKYDDNDN